MTALKKFIASEEVDDSLWLRNLSRTRWAAHAESIKSVWKSFEAILDCLDSLRRNASDGKTKTDAATLLMKLSNFDAIVSIMFMKNLIYKTKMMTEALQTESLNVIDTISLMESTTDILQAIAINGDKNGMDAEIEAAIAFAKRLNFDERHHRHRRPPQRIDSNPQTEVFPNMKSFYREEFTQVFDTQISMLRDVLLNCKKIVTPLMELLHPAKEVSSLQNVMKVVDMFPEEERPDPDALMAEVEVFKSSMAISQLKIEDLASAAKLCEQQKLVFPLSNKAY